MESKATKAAIAEIEKLKDSLKKGEFEKEDAYGRIPGVGSFLKTINEIIEEYKLKDRLDVIESIYDLLMEKEYNIESASFAKKYEI